MEYVNIKDLKPKTGDFRSGGRWKGTTRGERRERLITWMRQGKRKRSWGYNPETLTATEAIVNSTLIPEEMRISPYQEPAYGEISPEVSSFALVEEAVRLYGVCPDGTTGIERIFLSLDSLEEGDIKLSRQWPPNSEHSAHRNLLNRDK